MPAWVKSEQTWNTAKDAAKKSGHAGNYRVITHIYKKLGGTIASEQVEPDKFDDTPLPSELANQIDADLVDQRLRRVPGRHGCSRQGHADALRERHRHARRALERRVHPRAHTRSRRR